MVTSVREYLFSARRVAMDPSSKASLLLDVIRQGDTITPRNLCWVSVCAAVQMAIVGGHGDKLKQIILEHYTVAKSSGDTEYMNELYRLSRMFGEYAFESQVPQVRIIAGD